MTTADTTAPATFQGQPIDPRVRRLVAVLNRIPGIATCSSCGGHPRPTRGQIPVDSFNVSFFVTENRAGWRALALLAQAADQFSSAVTLTVWYDGGLRYDLLGHRHFHPDAVATEIHGVAARLEEAGR